MEEECSLLELKTSRRRGGTEEQRRRKRKKQQMGGEEALVFKMIMSQSVTMALTKKNYNVITYLATQT